ncbi:MAG: inositol monophosphatase [Anaerolineae bacterium]|nr:inositol monophosphatase [Anaerolineae bacterium]
MKNYQIKNSYSHWLTVACATAEEAGALVKSSWLNPHTVHLKGFRDIVTETDVAAERIILQRLREAFPDHAITSEEAGQDHNAAMVHWYVDPVDGTTNFARNNPNFCIAIAAVMETQPVVGVVFDPLRGHLFAASWGGGATLNGQPLRTSGITRVEDSIFSLDFPRDPTLRHQMWAYSDALLTHGRTMRTLGSAALNIAYVAAGWTDIYFHLTIQPWDQAAAGLIVQEAGGMMSTLSGTPWTPFCPDPIALSTPALLADLRSTGLIAPTDV